MTDLAQQIVVTIVAAGALSAVVWRIVAGLRRKSGPAACESCAVSTLVAESAKSPRRP